MNISEEQFINTYKKYPPSRWIKFAYRYFSAEAETRDMKVSNSIVWFLSLLFFIGFFATVINLPRTIISVFTFAFVGVLGILVLFLFAAVLCNNKRIKKIAKELNVSVYEYNELVDYFGDELK